MKRAILLIFLFCVLLNSAAWGQERGPLAMRIEFEWTLVGLIAGAGLGALIWLTDPADPNNNLSDSVANGAAWGAILGAGFGLFALQKAGQAPPDTGMLKNPLHPRNRITSDPVAVESGENRMFAAGSNGKTRKRIFILPLLNLRF